MNHARWRSVFSANGCLVFFIFLPSSKFLFLLFLNDALIFTLCFDSNENACFCLKERLKWPVPFPSVVSTQLLLQVFVLPWSVLFAHPSMGRNISHEYMCFLCISFLGSDFFCLRFRNAKIDVYAGHPLSSADVVVSTKEKCGVLNTLVAPNANREMAFFSLSPPAFLFYLLFPAFAIGAEGDGREAI